jgi:hypothetical protein
MRRTATNFVAMAEGRWCLLLLLEEKDEVKVGDGDGLMEM